MIHDLKRIWEEGKIEVGQWLLATSEWASDFLKSLLGKDSRKSVEMVLACNSHGCITVKELDILLPLSLDANFSSWSLAE